MWQFLVFALSISARVLADSGAAPPVVCGEPPRNIFSCLVTKSFIKPEFLSNCRGLPNECEITTCIFRNAGWIKEEKVDKQSVIAYFDVIAKEFPDWSAVVQHAKATCLSIDLPAQGVFLNCPAYDTTQCIMSSFIKNAQPSQWKSTAECQYPKQFAAACPVCPADCFVPQVPYGSCNACLALPRSP